MKHLFVSYQVAKQLKEKGFDEPCLACYAYGSEDNLIMAKKDNACDMGYTAAPLYQQIVDWFRKKHNMVIHVKQDWNNGIMLGYEGIIDKEEGYIDVGSFEDYYEALDKVIEEALKLI